MTYSDIITKVSEETGLDYTIVDSTYRNYWKIIREMIISLPLKEDLSDEDFNDLKCSFNIPSLGKLAVTKERYINVKKKLKFNRENAIKNKED